MINPKEFAHSYFLIQPDPLNGNFLPQLTRNSIEDVQKSALRTPLGVFAQALVSLAHLERPHLREQELLRIEGSQKYRNRQLVGGLVHREVFDEMQTTVFQAMQEYGLDVDNHTDDPTVYQDDPNITYPTHFEISHYPSKTPNMEFKRVVERYSSRRIRSITWTAREVRKGPLFGLIKFPV